jgi:hypothetical protein
LPPTLLQTDESHETEQQQVIVPVTNITLNEIELIELENTINPLRPSDHNGAHIYLEVLQFVHTVRLNQENN